MCRQAPGKEGDSPLSLIVPVFNEADNIRTFVVHVERHVPAPRTAYIVYDFDKDTTVPVVQELAHDRPWLRLVKNRYGRGVARAIETGFEVVATGPALVTMADLSDDLSQVPRMLELYQQGYRIVCPSRYMEGGEQVGGPFLKGWLSRIAGLSLYHLAGFPTRDATNNFRLYDAKLVNELGVDSKKGFEVALELTAKAHRRNVPVVELPTTWKDRTAGTSNFKLVEWLPEYLRWYAYAFGIGRQ